MGADIQEFAENTMIVSGFSQLPKGTTLYETYKVIGVVIVVDTDTTEIIDANFTFVTDLTNRFLSSIIRGYYMNQGVEPLLAEIKRRCKMPSQGAIIQAIKSCYTRYSESVSE